ncbi:MAG: hypothetical protein QM472_02440 [Spirochaetota bacterium]|nr:hypothetical protein [Spirochaetota bacterium]
MKKKKESLIVLEKRLRRVMLQALEAYDPKRAADLKKTFNNERRMRRNLETSFKSFA